MIVFCCTLQAVGDQDDSFNEGELAYDGDARQPGAEEEEEIEEEVEEEEVAEQEEEEEVVVEEEEVMMMEQEEEEEEEEEHAPECSNLARAAQRLGKKLSADPLAASLSASDHLRRSAAGASSSRPGASAGPRREQPQPAPARGGAGPSSSAGNILDSDACGKRVPWNSPGDEIEVRAPLALGQRHRGAHTSGLSRALNSRCARFALPHLVPLPLVTQDSEVDPDDSQGTRPPPFKKQKQPLPNLEQARSKGKRQTRKKFTGREEQFVREGVAQYGRNWKKILASYDFDPQRTGVDIKDKWRNMNKK
jgi:hypothetical protein